MNERTLKVLQFDEIVKLVKQEAETSVGKKRAALLRPQTTFDEVIRLQKETDEALTVLRLNKRPPFSQVYDLTDLLNRAKIGSTLNVEECIQVAQTIYTGRNVKSFIEQVEASIPLLEKLSELITPLRHVEEEIKRKIDEQGHIVDDASPSLKSIRQAIHTYEAQIRDRLRQLTRTKSTMLSDTIITIRNDRYVLPVKQEYRAQIGGIVHDQSASGQTIFMEPREVIELNNKLQETLLAEKREIEIILQQLTELIAAFDEALRNNIEAISQLDSIFARARVAVKMKATRPTINTDGIIRMKQARHPLIPLDEVVANDIELGDEYLAIVITGPNTGGKTVTLKTIGLCTLMAQAGLQVPAVDGCELALFEKVFADIGDEQSIEQNLSTFSSHMTNIVEMIRHVNKHTLVLFDEIGAGTDPQEGAALAMAILDYCIDQEARVVATTHYPELKAYGYNRKAVMNASVEFDVETLEPTYRLLLGVPGRSNAFEISSRLGLAETIIQRAKSYLGVDSKQVENMIAALEESRKRADKDVEEAYEILLESEKLYRDLKREWDNFQKERDNLYEKAEREAEKAIERAKEQAERIVEEMRQMKTLANWKEHEWIERRKQLEKALPHFDKYVEEDTTESTREFKVGDEIKHKTLQQTGQIIEKKSAEEYVIQMGALKITANRKDLQFVKSAKQLEVEPLPKVTHSVKRKSTVKPVLDLRGERYEDALYRLEKYIDDALFEGYSQVTIIHGKGTGVLRKGVEQFIKRHPRIKSSRLGSHGEGGSGVTVIELT